MFPFLRMVFIPCVLKFHKIVGLVFIHCAGYSVGSFNLKTMSFSFRVFSSIILWTFSSYHFLFSVLEIPIRNWTISCINPLVVFFLFFCFAGFVLLSRKFLQLYLPTFIEYLISAVFFFKTCFLFSDYDILALFSWMHCRIFEHITFSPVLYFLF